MATNDFRHWSEASHQSTAVYEAFLRAQREYDLAVEAVGRGEPAAREALIGTAVRLRQAQIDLMHFMRQQRPRPKAGPNQ